MFLESYHRPELTLENNCGYVINENLIQINIDQIHNNRNSNNISGSLSIELWSLPKAYEGNDFENAYCMTGTVIGEIYGQHFLENCKYDLEFTNPPKGQWNLCLMLREFNGQSYETVDYRNFSVPYLADFESKKLLEETKVEIKKENDIKKVDKVKTDKKISLNTASEKQIAKLKGVSEKLANLIVSSRPFKSSNDLMKLKGIGEKLLEKILEQSKL